MGYNFDEEKNMNDAKAAAQESKRQLAREKVYKTLEERIAESGVPLSFGEEIDWGKPCGDEVW